MERWEYRFMTVHARESKEAADELETLNALGQDGWEAVSFSPATAGSHGFSVTTSSYVLLLKRPTRRRGESG